MKTVFDIGMYDGSDTLYYLEEGYKVVAVEANPILAQKAKEKLRSYIESGRLIVVNAAIGTSAEPTTLVLSGDDLGASSIFEARIANRNPQGSCQVPTTSVDGLFALHGLPYYLKIDIEGADRLCVLALKRDRLPEFLSFEIGDDFSELVAHVQSVGYNKFKIINQCTFRSLANQSPLYDRVTRRILRIMGYGKPLLLKRAGKFFTVNHSSGPVPWKSEGRWQNAERILAMWRKSEEMGKLSGWYDLHAWS